MTGFFEWEIEQSRPSYSFYLTSHKCKRHPETAFHAARLAGSLTVSGPGGPTIVRRLRAEGLDVPVRFDGTGYDGEQRLDPSEWVGAQREADAAELFLPGVLVLWDRGDDELLLDIVREQTRIASELGAGLLLALDVRWIARKADELIEVLKAAQRPIAIVMVHRGDPLSIAGAVAGLRRLASRVKGLSILRSDHGAIGALAFGASHAAIGLTTTTRHYAPSSTRPWRRRDNSPRLFVRSHLDWFLASDIAGWASTGGGFECTLACCLGQSLARFLDAGEDHDVHNMTALADFADRIVLADRSDRGAEFLSCCSAATSRYGLGSLFGPQEPKAQLTGWVLS